MSAANARQVGGNHYAGAVQHWDVVWNYRMPYFPAQITRYVARHAKKAGLQDLEKALHYTDKYLELGGCNPVPSGEGVGMVLRFIEEQALPTQEAQLMMLFTAPHGPDHVRAGRKVILQIMESTYGAAGAPYVNQ